MMTRTFQTFGLCAIVVSLCAPPARSQTADQYNRASQAIQICSSPMGATIPECAKLRGAYGAPTLGGGSGPGGFKGLAGAGKAAGIANLLGSAMSAARTAAPAPSTPSTNTPAMIQQAVAACVRNAAGNSAMIQGCLAIATAGASPPR